MNENHIVKVDHLAANRGTFPAGAVVVSVVVGVLEPGRGVITSNGVSMSVSDAFAHDVAEVIKQLDNGVKYRFQGHVVRHALGALVYDDGRENPVPIPYNA